MQGLDLQANGAALDITNLALKVSGDAGVHPAAQEFSMNKFAFSASGVKGKDHFEARLDAPNLSLTKDKFVGDNIALNAKFDGALGNLVAKLSLPAIEGNPRVFKVSSLQLDADFKQPEQSFNVKFYVPGHRQYRRATIQFV